MGWGPAPCAGTISLERLFFRAAEPEDGGTVPHAEAGAEPGRAAHQSGAEPEDGRLAATLLDP